MKDRLYIDRAKPCYRGNLHAHSTLSDGRKSPEEVFSLFRAAGYHFMALTDHRRYIRITEHNTDSFIVLPGTERGGMQTKDPGNPIVHLGALDDPTLTVDQRFAHLDEYPHNLPWTGMDTAQRAIDELKAYGNMVIVNHPEWSTLTMPQLDVIDGFFAIEIYNHESERNVSGSYGTAYWDHLLRQGRKVFGVATDDSHAYVEADQIRDYFGGWVMVQAEEFSQAGLVTALKQGQFYSSTGPEIRDMRVVDGVVSIECSPCTYIQFKAFESRGHLCYNRDGTPLTSASRRIHDGVTYIRIECVDADGNIAWSNPIFVDEL